MTNKLSLFGLIAVSWWIASSGLAHHDERELTVQEQQEAVQIELRVLRSKARTLDELLSRNPGLADPRQQCSMPAPCCCGLGRIGVCTTEDDCRSSGGGCVTSFYGCSVGADPER